jgi:PAS domain S-box-containing protein
MSKHSGPQDHVSELGRGRPSVFPQGPTNTAWVLEDSPQQALVIQEALSPLLQVRLFHDSPQLLEALTSAQPDVLILDWHVPEISGREVLQVVRDAHDEVTLPVLIVTGSQSDMLEALATGANDYATKPFVAAELRARVSTLVRVRSLHGRARRAERELTLAVEREGAARAGAESDRAKLAASEERLRRVTDALPVLVSFVTAEERYGFVNKGYQEWFGQSSEELLGRTVREVVGELAYEVMGPYVQRGLAGERLTFEQYGVPYRTGGVRDVRVTFVPLRMGTEPGGYVALIQDITAERVFEAERERLAAHRAEVLERQTQFEKQLIGIVSHDLRTPLNVISLASARLTRDEELSAGAIKNVVRIQNAAHRAVRMVADLLDFTQARLGGGIPIERRATDLHMLLDSLVAELEPAFPDRKVECAYEGDGQGAWDPERITQVAQNLITNALKYSPEDSVVKVSTQRTHDAVLLKVHNLGTPIPGAQLTAIFEPLQRGPQQIDRVTRSVGLGLYIVKQIVEAHRGSVAVESSLAEGTTFVVSLPLRDP